MNYDTLLREHHLKITPQRLAIIELMDRAGHIAIEELYRMVRLKFATISLATLYKNVHTMMEKNLIREVKVPGQKTRYEIEKESHAHLLCTQCGRLEDFEFDSASLMEKACNTTLYFPSDISVVISGKCPNCQNY